MVELTALLDQFAPRRILVLGDLVLDQYTLGRVRRISPEAPVPVLHVSREEFRPGGAGNVALNFVALGNHVVLCGQIGGDNAGLQLVDALQKEGVDTRGVITNADYVTPIKNRMIAGNQQIVRVDHEEVRPLPLEAEGRVTKKLKDLLAGIDIIAISDYAKGFLTPSLLRWLIDQACQRDIPIIVDPKGLDYSRYSGATVVKPNAAEAIQASGMGEDAPLSAIADELLRQTGVSHLLITRSQDGISIFSKNKERYDCPAEAHAVKDVTGAGDTVLAMVTASLANGLDIKDAARLSNAAASLAIEQLGCARVSVPQLQERLREIAGRSLKREPQPAI